MGSVEIELKTGAVRRCILKSQGIKALMSMEAEHMAQRANSMLSDDPLALRGFTTFGGDGKVSSYAGVAARHQHAAYAQAKYHILEKSL